jgi:hypothetical protein
MKWTLAALALLATMGAPFAHAQTSEFESAALVVANPCLTSGSTPEAAPAAVAACEKLIVDLATLKAAAPDIAGHDLNVYHIVASMAHSRVASSYGRIDGVRSARVCQRSEDSWRHVSQIAPASSPAYAATIDDLVKSSTETIAKCRSEFGMPAGAPLLP